MRESVPGQVLLQECERRMGLLVKAMLEIVEYGNHFGSREYYLCHYNRAHALFCVCAKCGVIEYDQMYQLLDWAEALTAEIK